MRTLRIIGRVCLVLFALWLGFIGLLYYEMCQPPEKFSAFMAKLPPILMIAGPFETMWNSARGGALHPGDEAPDFRLKTRDGKSEIELASFRGRPVVLIFGSYT